MTKVNVVGEFFTEALHQTVDAIRVGVVQKVNRERRTRIGQCIGHQLRSQGRTADANHQHAGEFLAIGRHDGPCTHIVGKFQRRLQRGDDLALQLRVGSQLRIAQPIMAHHAAFVRIGNRARLQSLHVAEGTLDASRLRGEHIFRECHLADVDGESKVGVANKMRLKARPGGGGRVAHEDAA